MCLSFIGRIHTRLIFLIGPALATLGAVLMTGSREYYWLLLLTAATGLILDAGIYG